MKICFGKGLVDDPTTDAVYNAVAQLFQDTLGNPSKKACGSLRKASTAPTVPVAEVPDL